MSRKVKIEGRGLLFITAVLAEEDERGCLKR
jgi:hypothetical protein